MSDRYALTNLFSEVESMALDLAKGDDDDQHAAGALLSLLRAAREEHAKLIAEHPADDDTPLSDLRGKAETILAIAEDLCLAGAMQPCEFEQMVCEVAESYLAEHPADDDTPLSAHWLRSVGFKVRHWSKSLVLSFLAVNDTFSHWYIEPPDGNRSQRLQAEYKTRGDLRRLCRALGLPLEEAKDG